ncbi:hypothetical protein PWR63_17630 [Paraburkholderia sp. A2WS-5]|uniref:hypothetical protein n=1 Tax=unclassified Paraburkholderia TaxID=2615204 RepID=UPI003B819200
MFVCECEAPSIGYDTLAEIVIENAEEQLYDEVGEVADTLGPFEKDEVDELAALIKSWFDKRGAISCWKAVNIKRYARGDAEYDAALERLVAAQKAFADFAGAA